MSTSDQPPYGSSGDPTRANPQQGQPGSYGGGGYGQPPTGGQPYGQSPQGQPPRGGVDLAQESKGFFGALFDFSFTHFVTPMIVKVVYILVTVLLAIGALGVVISGFTQSAALGILFLILSVIGYFVYLAIVRMTLEFYLAIVRMSEDIHKRLK